MNLMTLNQSSPRDKARKRVVYALLGTAFFLPLNLIAMEICFVTAVLCGAYYQWKYGDVFRRRMPLAGTVLAFAVTSFISLAGTPHFLLALAFYAFTVLQYILLYQLTTAFVRDSERHLFICCLLASGLCVAVYGLYQYAHMLTLREAEWVDNSTFPLLRRRMYSTLYNPNLLSAFLLMVLSLAGAFALERQDRRQKFGCFCLVAVFFLCLILTYSRGAWISVGALVFFFGLFWDKRIWLLFLIVPAVLLFYHGGVTERLLSVFSHRDADTSVAMRLDMWSSAVLMIADHPFFGIGWGSFKYVYPVYNELIQDAGIVIFHAHNMYLNILAETGIIGFSAFMSFFFGNGWYAFRFLRRHALHSPEGAFAMAFIAAVMALAICSISDYDLFSTQISLTFWLLSGLFSGIYVDHRKKIKKSLRNNSQ